MTRHTLKHLLLTPGVLLSLAFAGCKFKPSNNMEEQPSIHPAFEPSAAFADGTSARPVPFGTVPVEPADSPGYTYADIRQALPRMTDAAGESDVVPFPITHDLLARGQQRFNIYCSMCHGRLGNGEGMIVHRGLTPPPSFHIDRLRSVSDGHLYNVITNGYGQMFGYSDRVRPEDRWMIVAYVRVLQASSASPNHLAVLSDNDRRKLPGTSTMTGNDPISPVSLPVAFRRRRQLAGLIGILGTGLSILVWVITMFGNERWEQSVAFYRAWLFAWLICLGLSLGAMATVMVHHLTGGEWGYFVRRFGEAAANVLPLLFVLFIPILFGLRHIYPWADPIVLRQSLSTNAPTLIQDSSSEDTLHTLSSGR